MVRYGHHEATVWSQTGYSRRTSAQVVSYYLILQYFMVSHLIMILCFIILHPHVRWFDLQFASYWLGQYPTISSLVTRS